MHTDRSTTFVKICCISSREEADLAVRAGASALGLVSAMPSGPGVIPEPLIRAIAGQVPSGVETFLLTCLQRPGEIAAQYRRVSTSAIQLCDRLPLPAYGELRRVLPSVRLIQVVHVTGPGSVLEAKALASLVDALLLDSGNQELAVKELGGTGRTHDWAVSREICEQVSIPVFLAGGLNPGNVARALKEVSPSGVDVCSGVRSEGALDELKLRELVSAARGR